MTIYVMRPSHRHSFGVAFAQAESKQKSKKLVQERHGCENLDLEIVGTLEEYEKQIRENGVMREIYRR